MTARPGAPRLLVLGGTGEGSALVRALAATGRDVTLSLAGRTRAPRPEPVPTRIGGFGGADGLAAWIAAEGIALVVDATHPFAARISANAAAACARVRVPLLAVRRPPWGARPGDRWIPAAHIAASVAALGEAPRRVFLTVGRQEVAAFAAAPQHAYLVRTIEPVGAALLVPRLVTLPARGPFAVDDEVALMRVHRIEVVVSKNAGGPATYAKIEAARRLGLPVVMVARPALPDVEAVPDVAAALARIAALLPQAGTLRSV